MNSSHRPALLVIIALSIAACGGGGNPAPGTTSTPGGTSPGPTSTPTDPTTTTGGATTSGSGRVVVDLGDRRYEFITSWSAFGTQLNNCQIPTEEDPEYFTLKGYALTDPSEQPDLQTPAIDVNLPLSHSDVDLEVNWVHYAFSIELEAENEHWVFYHPRDVQYLDTEGETTYADSYPGIGSWTASGNRMSGEIALFNPRSGTPEIVMAPFEVTCP